MTPYYRPKIELRAIGGAGYPSVWQDLHGKATGLPLWIWSFHGENALVGQSVVAFDTEAVMELDLSRGFKRIEIRYLVVGDTQKTGQRFRQEAKAITVELRNDE